MPEISLKCRNGPRLKANKTNDLINDHTVPDSKTDVIQMLARSVVDPSPTGTTPRVAAALAVYQTYGTSRHVVRA